MNASSPIPARSRTFAISRAHLWGVIALVAADVLWGSTFTVNSTLSRWHVSAEFMMATRFTLAAVMLLPLVRLSRPLVIVAMEIGFWEWLGYYFQTIGLKYTSANRAAFITNLTVVMVPLLSAMVSRRIPGRLWIAVAVAVLGVGLLAYDPKDSTQANVGDLWTLACALAYSIFIIRLETVSKDFPVFPLSAIILCAVSLYSLAYMPIRAATGGVPGAWPPGVFGWSVLLYLGLVATAVTALLQGVGLQRVSATEAAVIFCLEPVFASIFAYIFLHESFGLQGYTGAALVMLAALLSQWKSNPARPTSPG